MAHSGSCPGPASRSKTSPLQSDSGSWRRWRRTVYVVGLFALAAAGCTPLAKTAYPVVWDDQFLGAWRLEMNPELQDAQAEERAPPILLTITRKPSDRVREQQADEPAEIWPRYAISAVQETGQDAETVELIGGLLASSGRLYFTFQQASGQTTPVMSLFHTPLQHTLMIERDNDTLEIWLHPVVLVWTPTEFAGELQLRLPPVDAPGDDKRRLVQNFDDIIAYYDAAPDESWILLGTASRLRDER